VSKGLGTGGKTSSKLAKKEQRKDPPPKAGAYNKRVIAPTNFRRMYDVGDIPATLNFTTAGGKICWKVKPEELNFNHYLPVFFDGLREKQDPYRTISVQGAFELLSKGGNKIFHVIPQLIIPIKGNDMI